MDEITMFRSLQPEVPATDDADAMRAAARERLTATLGGAPGRPRRPVTQRTGQRRWRLPAAVATVACATAAAAVAALVLSDGGSPAHPTAAKVAHRVSIVTADWSIKWNASDTVTITLAQANNDLMGLQQTLQSEGVNTIARIIPMKTGMLNGFKRRYPACSYNNLSQVSLPVWQAIVTSTTPGGPDWAWTIHLSAMPAGSALYFQEYSMSTVNMGTVDVDFQFTALTSDVLPTCTPNSASWRPTAQAFPLPWPSGSALASPPPSS